MDHYESYVETKTYTRREFIKTTCDKCNAEIEYKGAYSTRGFCLSFDEGESYGNDGGHNKGWEVEDLCNSCLEWLKSILIENNVKLKEIDHSW